MGTYKKFGLPRARTADGRTTLGRIKNSFQVL
jgi:hypothetical protein